MDEAKVEQVPGRSCAGCTMCCKIMAIPALDKPAMTWCTHCAVGTGCRIYADRPDDCRIYFCQWIADAAVAEHWRPSKSRMVLTYKPHHRQIMIHVDIDRPNAWRAEPFHSDIRRWVAKLYPQNGQVLVRQGHELIAVLPDGERNLGPIGEGRAVMVRRGMGPSGPVWDAVALEPDDPRASVAKGS